MLVFIGSCALVTSELVKGVAWAVILVGPHT